MHNWITCSNEYSTVSSNLLTSEDNRNPRWGKYVEGKDSALLFELDGFVIESKSTNCDIICYIVKYTCKTHKSYRQLD